jgi:hypothetical protein
MSVMNYSSASELHQVHREEIQSRLCNQAPTLNSPQASHHTHSLGKAYIQISQLDTQPHIACPLLASTRCPTGQEHLKPLVVVHRSSFNLPACYWLYWLWSVTLQHHCPSAGAGNCSPQLKWRPGCWPYHWCPLSVWLLELHHMLD